MLIKASIKNFKSFDDLVEISMISSSKIRSHKNHKMKIKQTSILKNGVIYGANAAGKSNLIGFFDFFKWSLYNGMPLDASNLFCRNKKENKFKNTEFELSFTVNDKFYAYGYTAILAERKITSEWLFELKQDGSANKLFERFEDCSIELEEKGMTDFEKNRFNVYKEDFIGNESQLFLSEMNRNKKIDNDSKLFFFTEVFQWLTNNIIVLTPNRSLTNFEYYYDDESMQEINKLLGSFDTGISEISIKKIDVDEFSKKIPKEVYKDFKEEVENHLKEKGEVRMSMRINDKFFNIIAKNNEEPEISTICLKHGKSFYDFEFEDESDGTRRIFGLIDMILSKKEDILYVVDELERSLHPKLTAHFLKLFIEKHSERKVQLLFSTHEDTIMDMDLFRRDEIWFIERNNLNSSELYPLDKFKERYDKKLSKAYLDGRYGAIPVFTSFQFR